MENVFAMFDITPFDGVMILVGAVFFVVIWKSLQKVLFDPYLKLVEEREQATSGAKDYAAREVAEAKELTQEYERRIMEGRIAALEEKIKELDRAKQEAAKIISQAENEASTYLDNERRITEESMNALKSEVMKEASAMVAMIVDKVKSSGGEESHA